ncbi:uncharacterized protein LOC120844584 [Ixodes scapularis]|uniref:uncharacterized protein LOC120844584 n=1 Tax=Ixodes scapularis TaxID=6945 RepID=UPI001A9EB099|nr:uncharacterized protein LOC120844584 [Ixodes scapularis]
MCDPNYHALENQTLNKPLIANNEAVPTGTVLQSSLKATDKEPRQVLLQTAKAWAEGRRDRAFVLLLFDGGSQGTFVRKGIAEKLNLKVLEKEDLTIFTFEEGATTAARRCRRVELWLRNQYSRKDVRIEASEVPQICAYIIAAPPEIALSVPEDMLIADTDFINKEREKGISILIGAGYNWEVVSGSVKRLDKGLMAVDTIFGWTLQGPMSSTSSTAIYSSITGVLKVTTADITDISAQLR